MIQVAPTTPVYFLPENLFSLLSRPGRELTVRVLQIEGKRLYLEFGGDKFQAQVSGALNPEDFRVGESLRLRVERTEPEIVLRVIGPQKRSSELFLMIRTLREGEDAKELVQSGLKAEFQQLLGLLRESLVRPLKMPDKVERQEEENVLGNIQVKKPIYEENRFILPIVFPHEHGWGYFEFEVPEEKEGSTKLFSLRVFFPYLGLLEAIFSLKSHGLQITMNFSNKESLNFAKEHLKELKETLSSKEGLVNIYLQQKTLMPGYLLESRG